MKSIDKVAVCSRSFSKNMILREELLSCYENVTFNEYGKSLHGVDLIKFLEGHKKAIIGLEVLDEYVLSSLPVLKVIGKYGIMSSLLFLVEINNFFFHTPN